MARRLLAVVALGGLAPSASALVVKAKTVGLPIECNLNYSPGAGAHGGCYVCPVMGGDYDGSVGPLYVDTRRTIEVAVATEDSHGDWGNFHGAKVDSSGEQNC